MSQMKLTDWEKARKEGKTVFRSEATNTIRTYPENYCLAVLRDGKWTPFVDAGVGRRKPLIESLIVHHETDASEKLIAILTTALANG